MNENMDLETIVKKEQESSRFYECKIDLGKYEFKIEVEDKLIDEVVLCIECPLPQKFFVKNISYNAREEGIRRKMKESYSRPGQNQINNIPGDINGKEINFICCNHGGLSLKKSQKCYVCDKCQMSFDDLNLLKQHEQTHAANNEERQFMCDKCGYQTKQKYHLSKHMKSNCNLKRFNCPTCGKLYKSKHTMEIHMRVHTGVRPPVSTERRFGCPTCGKRYKNKHTMEIHTRVHTGERPHVCKVCLDSFRYLTSLRDHMLRHTGEKPYVCQFCSKGFITKSACSVHVRLHTGERPYVCDFCDQAFRTAHCLTAHKRRHTGEKPFVCHICQKRFMHRNKLSRHMKSHYTYTHL